MFALLDINDRSFMGIVKLIIVIAAIVAVVYICLKAMGITLPPWLIQIIVVVVVAVVALLAIGFLASL